MPRRIYNNTTKERGEVSEEKGAAPLSELQKTVVLLQVPSGLVETQSAGTSQGVIRRTLLEGGLNLYSGGRGYAVDGEDVMRATKVEEPSPRLGYYDPSYPGCWHIYTSSMPIPGQGELWLSPFRRF